MLFMILRYESCRDWILTSPIYPTLVRSASSGSIVLPFGTWISPFSRRAPRRIAGGCGLRLATTGHSERSTSLVRVQRQGLREHFGMKDRRASSAVPVVRHDIEIVAVGLHGHTRGL